MPANKRTFMDRLHMKFNKFQLEQIIIAIIHNPENKKFISNVDQLFKLFAVESYNDDIEKETMVFMIKNITALIMNEKISDSTALMNLLSFEGKYESDAMAILERIDGQELSEKDLQRIDKTISNQLKYKTLDEKADALMDLLNDFKTDSCDNIDDSIEKIEESIGVINKDLKAAKESLNDSKEDMNLSSNNFVSFLDEIIQEERNPATKVKTGIQYLNTMLGQGFERSRLYLACGMAKGGKSAFLLQCALWAKKYNKFQTKDPTKKPVIVYLSMENTIKETTARIWNYCFDDKSEIKDYDKLEAASMLEKAGVFTPNDPYAPELRLWFRSNRSINANDIAGMLDDLEKEDCECVFLIVDYLARMKAVEFNKEQRLELSNITNDLKTLATDFDIPVLSAHQLNREAFKAYETAESFEEKVRASNNLGVSQIGDSIDVVRNCDMAFIVNRIQKRSADENGEFNIVDRYLFIKLIASRMKMPTITSFQHRFKDGNGMALIDDIYANHPYSVDTDKQLAREQLERNGQKTGRGGRQIIG